MNGYDNGNPYDIPEEEIGLYVQEALDELEFILGDVDTKYGALRASLGHPRPWKLNYVEVCHLFFMAVYFQRRKLTSFCDHRLATKINFPALRLTQITASEPFMTQSTPLTHRLYSSHRLATSLPLLTTVLPTIMSTPGRTYSPLSSACLTTQIVPIQS